LAALPITWLFAKDPNFKYIDLLKVSRFNEDRVAFQHVQKFTDPLLDNSLQVLLIIRKSKMYLMKDGYDASKTVKEKRLMMDMELRLIDDEALWENKLNGKPDYIKITDRRVEVMNNLNEDFVSKNFGPFYTKVRDSFIKRHVAVFRQLMRNRRESGLYVERRTLPKPFRIGAKPASSYKTKYYISARAKTIDEKIYFCEDADGDGITETFTVTLPDGFDWGYNSGPNMIFIYKNKTKEIEALVGKLANEAFFGTSEEEKTILESFPKEKEIVDMIEDIVPDEKFYK
jgi:hypothetical protein